MLGLGQILLLLVTRLKLVLVPLLLMLGKMQRRRGTISAHAWRGNGAICQLAVLKF